MPYIGRELDRGNYLKLDDISSSFDSSTTTFNLTNGGKAFYPGSAFSILVVLAGVVQEPETAYQINQAQITFASAPLAGDQFFCIALGVALGVNTPANGSVNGTQLAKPFNYDGYFYLDDTNNRVGIATATPQKPLHVVGEGQFDSVRVLGDLTVDGTTTTLDTVVTEVDRLEVGANNNTVGVAITQSGSGDAAYFMGGDVGIGTNNPQGKLHISDTNHPLVIDDNSSNVDQGIVFTSGGSSTYKAAIRLTPGGADKGLRFHTGGYANSVERLRIHSNGKFSFGTATAGTAKYTFNSAGTNEVARFESTDTGAYLAIKDSSSTSINFVEGGGDVLSLGVNNVERLRITTSGVGIGTDDPQSQFEVFGTSPIIRSKHSTSQKYTQINHDGTDGYLDWSSGGLIFRGASNTERFRITSAGVVKVGSNTLITPSTDADNFVIDTGDVDSGLSILSATTGRIYFGDAASTDQGSIRYVHTDDSMRFETNSSEKLRITSDGKMLLGTNTSQGHASANLLEIGNYTLTNAGITINNPTNGAGLILFGDSSSTNRRGRIEYTHVSDAFRFYTADSERLRITSDGKIGIGENTPGTILHIKKNDATGPTITLENGSNETYINNWGSSGPSGRTNRFEINAVLTSSLALAGQNISLQTGAAGDSNERLRITSNGNIGVGGATGTDYSLLDGIVTNTANGSAGLLINSSSSSHNAYMSFGYGSGSGTSHADQFSAYIGRVGDNTLILGTDNNIRLRVTSGGNLQVKGGNLHLDSNAELALFEDNTSGTYTNSAKIAFDFSGNVARMRSSVNGSATIKPLAFYIANTPAIFIGTDGKVGINETSPTARLEVKSTGATAIFNSGAANDGRLEFEYNSSRVGLLAYHSDRLEIQTDSSKDFTIRTNGANERLRITSAGSIGIGVASPVTDVDISQKTGAVALPQGTTAQRPSGSAPYIRKNTTNNALEYFDGTSWVEIITDYFPTGSTILG